MIESDLSRLASTRGRDKDVIHEDRAGAANKRYPRFTMSR